MAALGDINGDGKGDIAVGAILASPGGMTSAGSVYVLSGYFGLSLYRVDGASAGGAFGSSIAVFGDVDSDKVLDFIVGAPKTAGEGVVDAGAIYLYSGKAGKYISITPGAGAGWRAGQAVAGVAEKTAAFAYGAPFASPQNKNGAGLVYIPFLRPAPFEGEAAGDNFGSAIVAIGDVNADGFGDFLVGAPGATTAAGAGSGRVYLFSGKDGALLYKRDGSDPGAGFGSSIAGIGDVDGDGIPDFIVGAPKTTLFGKPNAGKVFIYSGRTGNLMISVDGPRADSAFGFSVASAGDMDGDGKPDIAVAAPGANNNAGMVTVFSGKDGRRFLESVGVAGEEMGRSIAYAGDLDGDGRPDIIVGAPGALGSEGRPNGRVYVLTKPRA